MIEEKKKQYEKTNRPFFSIMIPVYNGEDLVSQAIESVVNQQYGNWELIIMNDGSTDKTLQICEFYAERDSRIKVYTHPNVGLGKNRNLGFQHLGGRWTIFLDHDDLILENFLTEDLMRFLCACEDKEIDLIAPARLCVDYNISKARKDAVYCDGVVKGGNGVSWKMVHEFATMIYRTELLMHNDIRFNETKPEMESIFRHKAAYFSRKILFSNQFYFGVRRANANSITNTWNYLSVIPIRFSAYVELERWHKNYDKCDTQAYLESKLRTIEIVREYVLHSLKNKVPIVEVLAGLKETGMYDYIKDCMEVEKIRKLWMVVLVLVPSFYLLLTKSTLDNRIAISEEKYPDVYKSFLDDATGFPQVFAAIMNDWRKK